MFEVFRRWSLQVGVQIVAIINLSWTVLLIGVELILITQLGFEGIKVLDPELSADVQADYTECAPHLATKYTCKTFLVDPANHYPSTPEYTTALQDEIVSLIWISSWIIDIGFSILLYRAAKTRSRSKCLTWFYFRLGVLIFRVLFLTLYTFLGLSLLTKIPVMIFFVFRIYSLWLVRKFIDDLEADMAMAQGLAKDAEAQVQISATYENTAAEASEAQDVVGNDLKEETEARKKAKRNSRRLSSPFLAEIKHSHYSNSD